MTDKELPAKQENMPKLAQNSRRVYVYIDGFNLYRGIAHLSKPHLKWLDLGKLADSFIQNSAHAPRYAHCEKVKYFTAPVRKAPEKLARQKHYWRAIAVAGGKTASGDDRVEIIQGKFLPNRRKCKECGRRQGSFEEKQTDVNIACHLLTDLHEDKFDIAYVVSGDSDLCPPVQIVKTKGKPVIVASPPNRKNSALADVASGWFGITEHRLRQCLLPDTVGKKLSIPPLWAEKRG